jgi:MFS family permease
MTTATVPQRREAPDASPAAPVRGARPGLILTALVLAMLAFTVVQTSVVPILPTLASAYHLTTATVAWVMTANLLAAAVLTPLLGRMGDLYGRKWVLVLSVGGLVLGSALAFSVHSWTVLLVARVLQGLGGGILPLAIAVIRDELPREKVTGAVSLVSASLGVGSGIGMVATGWVMEHWTYQTVFLMGLILGAVALLAVLVAIRHDPVEDRNGSMDPLGTTLLAVWLSALLLALSEGETWGWGSARDSPVRRRRRRPRAVDPGRAAHQAPAGGRAGAGQARGGRAERRRVLRRLRDVRLVHHARRLHPDPEPGRLRLRRHHPALRHPAAALGGRLLPRRPDRRPADQGRGTEDPDGPRRTAGRRRAAVPRLPARPPGRRLRRLRRDGPRHRPGLRGDARLHQRRRPGEQAGIANSVNAVLRTVGGAVGTSVVGVILSSKTISAALLAHTPLAGMSLPTGDAYRTAFLVCGVLGLAAAVVPFLVRAKRNAA